MRLICPNCGAQYEVDPGVIPEAGRDVQCSNCGHSWFQRHPHMDEGKATPEVKETPAEPETAGDVTPEPEPEFSAEAQETETEAAQPARQPQSGLDEEVTSILREEAEREKRERQSESGGIETQPDLGLDQTVEGPTPAVQEQDAEQDDAMSADLADPESSRGELLPDIEEINSTLGAGAEGTVSQAETDEVANRKGFRRGFAVAIVVFALMALVYVLAPGIADMAPGAAPSLSAYVDWVNGLRSGLDSIMLRAVEKLTGLLDQMSGDSTAG